MLWFQPYFTSKYNFITGKFTVEKKYDFSKGILFHKTLEVLINSKFKVIKYDEKRGIIVAASKLSWSSWGENIYINIEGLEDSAMMKFCSVSLFGIYSWGKNEDNYQKLIRNFDESLII